MTDRNRTRDTASKRTSQPRRLSAIEEVDLQEELREMEQEEELIRREAEIRRKKQRLRRQREEQHENFVKRLIFTVFLVIVAIILTVLLIVYIGTGRKHTAASGETNADSFTVTGGSDKRDASGTGSASLQDVIGNKKSTAPKADRVTLSAVGDNLVSQRILDQALERGNGSYDFSYVYADMKAFFGAHELNWVDVETVINDRIEPAGYPTFSTPGKNGQDLKEAGLNIFSLSNNHTNDLGLEGVEASLSYWTSFTTGEKNVLTTGLWKTKDGTGSLSGLTGSYEQKGLHAQPDVYAGEIPVYTCENGRKVAFLSYTEMSNMDEAGDIYGTPQDASARIIYTYETDLIRAQIQKAKEEADAVVVACHWGEEDTHQINESQKKLARDLAGWGADLIIGDHPHVVQDGAWIDTADGRRVFCVYSLGNFVSTQEQPDEIIGVALDCTLSFTGEGEETVVEVKEPKLVPIVTDYGEGGTNAKVCLLSGYTEQQASANGMNTLLAESGSKERFTLEYIRGVLEKNISSEFLKME
ncbi:MAG: CapA family protein [Eubacterium sp.]|nr:CapA family protein [Eubacterium sp.]